MLAKSGRLVALAAVTLLFSSFAHAAAQRTFVSAGGVDNPTCALAAPCRSFAAAIAAIVAGGEVIVLDSAGYGPVTITKAASIIAPPGIYAGVSVFAGNGVTINAPGADVVLRGLAINGLGGDAGIVIVDAARVRIESCVVSRMSATGIFHQAAAAQVTVSDTIVRDNAQSGIWMVTSTASITLERFTSEGNLAYGLYVSPNVNLGQLDVTISDSSFARNGGAGILFDAGANAAVFASIDRSTFTENGLHGVRVMGSSSALMLVAVQRSTFRRNIGNGIIASGDSPALIEVNASDNVMHRNLGFYGMLAFGTGAAIRASGNTFDPMGCASGGTIFTYHNNSVLGVQAGCTTPASLF